VAAAIESAIAEPEIRQGLLRVTTPGGHFLVRWDENGSASAQIKMVIANVRKGLDRVCATAPWLTKLERWAALVRYIVAKIVAATTKIYAPPMLISAILLPLTSGWLRKKP